MPDIWMDVDIAVGKVPVNIMPLIDDSDFKTRETGITYDQAGMDLVWNFVTTNGVFSQTAVTPTTGGDYDWVHRGDAMYSIEIPASGGASINNSIEGSGWFTGICTGVLPWRGPIIGFRAASLNNLLIDSAYSVTRGLSGTALPNAAADAAGGLPISDAGGLDLDHLTEACSGTVTVETADTVFNLTATLGTLSGNDDAYNNMIICMFDNSGSIYETRRITDYDGTNTRVTLDAELTFPGEDGVDTWAIYRNAYAPVGAASITDGDKNDIVDKVWDELDADHMTVGTKGLRMHHAGRGRY